MTFPVLEEKDPDRDTEYAIDGRKLIYVEIRRDWPVEDGVIARHPQHTGFYYECTTAGETAHHWPARFPRAAGQTVTDGSAVWTARAPSSVSLPTVSSVTWELDPTGELAVDSERIEGGIVFPTLTGGVAGASYDLTAHITWSTGVIEDVTVTIPVAER